MINRVPYPAKITALLHFIFQVLGVSVIRYRDNILIGGWIIGKGRFLALLGLTFMLITLAFTAQVPNEKSVGGRSNLTSQEILAGVYPCGSRTGTPAAIVMFGSAEQLAKSGYGAIKVSIVEPSKKNLTLRPEEEVPVEVRITYLGSPEAPERVVVVLGNVGVLQIRAEHHHPREELQRRR